MVMLDAHMPSVDGFAVAEMIRKDPALAAKLVMMLSAARGAEDITRCREMGIDTYVTKPVARGAVFDAVEAVMEPTDAGDADARTAPGVHLRPLRVLLAEDNPVNQRLTACVLTRRGHQVEVASDGAEAMRLYHSEPFDVILMDVHMPDVDGLAVTRHIRQDQAGGDTRVPIIAMAAHTMQGNHQQCLNAGMDGYVSKPIDPRRLIREIQKVVPERLLIREDRPEPVPPAPSGAGVFDPAEALDHLAGNADVLRNLVALAVETLPVHAEDLAVAVRAGDLAAVARRAHRLKGGCADLRAGELFELAYGLEVAARQGDAAAVAATAALLPAALDRLLAALKRAGFAAPDRPATANA
jgi:CheY-like chemotaxis protein